MYNPTWEGVVEGYAKNNIGYNLWRFECIGYEYGDLLCESYLIFRRCKSRFTGKDAPEFMAFFKIVLKNKFNTLASRDFKLRRNAIEGCISDREDLVDTNGKINELLVMAPKEVKEIISLIFNSPRELLEALGFFKSKSRGLYNNKLLCELLGYDPQHWDLSKTIQEYFYE